MIENYVTDFGRIYPILPVTGMYIFMIILVIIEIIIRKRKKEGLKIYSIIGMIALFIVILIFDKAMKYCQSNDQMFRIINDVDINKALNLGKYKALLNDLFSLFIQGHILAAVAFLIIISIKKQKNENGKADIKELIKNGNGLELKILLLGALVFGYFTLGTLKDICVEVFNHIPNKDFSNWSITEEEITLEKKYENGLDYIRVKGYDEYYPIDRYDINKYQNNKKAYIIYDKEKKIIGYFSGEQYQYNGNKLNRGE